MRRAQKVSRLLGEGLYTKKYVMQVVQCDVDKKNMSQAGEKRKPYTPVFTHFKQSIQPRACCKRKGKKTTTSSGDYSF